MFEYITHSIWSSIRDIDGHELKQKTKWDSIGIELRKNRNLQKKNFIP